MSINHTVKQGEYLSSIARRYGFSDYKVIWNDKNNAKLKEEQLPTEWVKLSWKSY